MATRIIEGCGFGVNDGEGRPLVLVINQALARRDYTGESPVGQRFYFVGDTLTVWEIVAPKLVFQQGEV